MKQLLYVAGCVLTIFLTSHPKMTFSESLDIQVDEKKHSNHIVDSLDILIYVCLLIMTIVTVWTFKHKRVRFLHESGLAVTYGLVVGLLLRILGSDAPFTTVQVVEKASNSRDIVPDVAQDPASSVSNLQQPIPPDRLVFKVNVSSSLDRSQFKEKSYTYTFKEESKSSRNEIRERATFNPELFFYVLLPPIIFHAGYSMRKKHFFDNFGAIMAFALVGTTVSTFVVAIVMYGFGQLIAIDVIFLDTLYFGAIISATDPVTTLALFQDLKVDSMLNGLVLGESLLNDAVAIVLCSSIEEYAKVSSGFQIDALIITAVKFVSVVFGSIGLGALIASLTAIVTKFTKLREYDILESSLFTLMSYSSYLLAEVCSMSGIVSVLFCGIFQAHYTFRNLSGPSKQRTKQFFELLNFLAENFIFSYIGVSMFTFSQHLFNFIFIFGAFLAIGIARACNIYPLSLIVNCGRRNKIPINFQHMMWFSGLRGAMAFALAVQNTMSPARQMFFTTTCLISIITVIFIGGLTTPVLTHLQIPVGEDEEEKEELLNDPESLSENDINNRFSNLKRSFLARILKNFDANVMKPLLTETQPNLQETLPGCCMPLARLFTTQAQVRQNPTSDAQQETAANECSEVSSYNEASRP